MILKCVELRYWGAYRMRFMNKRRRSPAVVFGRLGKVNWNEARDAFIVETESGAILQLCPNSGEDVAHGVHVDEITVAEGRQGRGAATKAMAALCQMADEEGIVLKGGPIGWSNDPMSERFVAWLTRFGVERDPSPPTVVHDQTAFYVRRLPRLLG
jgi:GNAT superfamily N-acetyltransferase